MNFLSIRRNASKSNLPSSAPSDDDSDREGRSRSRSRARSLSPWRRSSKSRSRTRAQPPSRDTSAEGVRGGDSDAESEYDAAGGAPARAHNRPLPSVVPSHAFVSEDESDDDQSEGGRSEDDASEYGDYDDDGFEMDEEVERNTEANASADTPLDFLTREGTTMVYPGEGPNLLPPPDPISHSLSALPPRLHPRTGMPPRRKSTRSGAAGAKLELKTGRPVFEKNRCTVVLTHGDPDRVLVESQRKRRKYLVASDLSDESSFALQWAIGTVLREGDEVMHHRLRHGNGHQMCVRPRSLARSLAPLTLPSPPSVDSEDANPSASSKAAKLANQRERQTAALQLTRQATALLERTRLNVRIVCQAIHAKVPRHMLVDMIDWEEPTLVIVGSRGLTQLKGSVPHAPRLGLELPHPEVVGARHGHAAPAAPLAHGAPQALVPRPHRARRVPRRRRDREGESRAGRRQCGGAAGGEERCRWGGRGRGRGLRRE
ncbi:SPOSA6832_04493, partial [Sporobolomyces salmonicolor]